MEYRILNKWDKKREFEFRKSDIYNAVADVDSSALDPYPTHEPNDIVERRIIGKESFVEGKHVSNDPVQLGFNLVIDNLKYTVVSLTQEIGLHMSEITTVFVASHIEEFVQPPQLLESIRKEKLIRHSGPG